MQPNQGFVSSSRFFFQEIRSEIIGANSWAILTEERILWTGEGQCLGLFLFSSFFWSMEPWALQILLALLIWELLVSLHSLSLAFLL
jgi:hypothetical protein